MKRLIVALAMVLLCGVGVVQAANFSDFSDVSTLTLNGLATKVDSGATTAVRLSGSSWQGSQASSLFTNQAYGISPFSTHFTFQITNAGGIADGIESGGDGFTFTIQAVGPSSVGTGGGGLGYGGSTNPAILSSVAIEFDTFQNIWDADSNHLGIEWGGNFQHQENFSALPVGISSRFDDGNVWHAWVDYDGTALQVRADQSAIRPADAMLTHDLDIAEIIGQEMAFLGFTAGAEGDYGNTDILSWEFSQPEATHAPEPSTLIIWSLLGTIGIAYGWRRRRRIA